MGRPKESLPIGGTTMLNWQCQTLLSCTEPVVTVGRDPSQALPKIPVEVDVTVDELPGEGPLAAIVAGLKHLRDHHGFGERDAAMTVGCDQPFLTAATVRWLRERIGDADVLMPQAREKLQPLTAIYRIAALEPAIKLLNSGGRRPREIAAHTNSRIVTEDELREFDPDLRFLRNLNSPADYDAVRNELDRKPDNRPN
ncbi:MAG: molybdopterin-guanine dinucleotide biosynthesis protein A [Planctomycetota bacterium]|jgi:molybdopterin-guanine dinucleotide biosynthesis protein A